MDRSPVSSYGIEHRQVRALIIASNASAVRGGEASLPVHWFRELRRAGCEAWLLAHERRKRELLSLFPMDQERLYFARNGHGQRALARVGRMLPTVIAGYTVGAVADYFVQREQRGIAQILVKKLEINVVHVPMPVSPKYPSILYNLGAPVVFGPMNGGMDFPPAFRTMQGLFGSAFVGLARMASNLANHLFQGKKRASLLLVANTRTRSSLPKAIAHVPIVEFCENGVDLDLWSNNSHVSESPKTVVRFAFVGSLIRLKGVDILLEAFQKVRSELASELHIIGDGEERNHLEDLAIRIGVSESVVFYGALPQVKCAEILARTHVFTMCSLHECAGAVILEAMARANPVIVAEWGGPAEYVNRDTGVLVPPTSRRGLIDGFAEAMIRLAHDPDLRRRLGAAGRRRVVDYFDWRHRAARMLDLYRTVVSC